MAPSQNSQDNNAAFLEACINKRRPVQDVWESLGLYSQTVDTRKDPDFLKNEANELFTNIKRIAKSYATTYRGDLERLHSDLAEETTFSEEVFKLGQQYGSAIWGRMEDGEIRSPNQSQGRGIDEHDWDVAKDRNSILFYIRCWIVSLAVRNTSAAIGKVQKGKGGNRESEASRDNQNTVEYLSDSSGSSDVPYRAPEPPRMLPTPEPRRQAAPPPSASRTSFKAGARAVVASGSKHAETTISSKRKAQGGHERTPLGKLPKPSKGMWDIPVHLREQPKDLYAISTSPTQRLNLGRSLFESQRPGEGTAYDTDASYMPREATAETETVVDGEDVTPREVDQVIQSAIALANEDSMQYEYQNQPTAGPSGTYRNPLRQDSVIPSDTPIQTQTQTHTVRTDRQPAGGQHAPHKSPVGGELDKSITQSLPELTNWQQREFRRELFKLLLSYLNSINQFSPDAYDLEAEERTNILLHQFWLSDVDAIKTRLSDDAARLQTAFESWMSMRHRLSTFRSATRYFGRPGEQWTEYLRGMDDDVQSAQAMLAYVDLQGVVSREGECGFVADTFDHDLARVFDALTMMSHCNGPEAFRGVRRYNEALLEWFREGDV